MGIKLPRYLKKNRVIRAVLSPIILTRKAVINLQSSIREYYYDGFLGKIDRGCVRVRVPWFKGVFNFDIKSKTLKGVIVFKNFEKDMGEIVFDLVKGGSDIIDVGANVGLYTVLTAKAIARDSRVLALEPIPSAFKLLKENITINNVQKKVIALNCAIAEKKKSAKMNYLPSFEEYSRIGNKVHPKIAGKKIKSINVNCETIDGLVEKYKLNPCFIKIDTEGFDYFVLKSAAKTIKKFRPIVACEFVPETQSDYKIKPSDIIDFFEKNSYKIEFVEKEIILAKPEELQ